MMKRFLFLTVLALFVSLSSLAFAAGPQPIQPSITVIYPNGGEIWGVGNAKPFGVAWKVTGNVGWVSLYLKFPDGATGFLTDAYGPSGKVTIWMGANSVFQNINRVMEDGQYKVFITNSFRDMNYKGPNISDESDSFFTISSSVFSIPLKGMDPAFFMEFNKSITVATGNSSILLLGEVNVYQRKDEKGWLKITTGFSFACKQLGKKDVYKVIEIKTYEKGTYAINLRVVRVSVGSCSVWETTDGKSIQHFVQITPDQSAQGAPSKMIKNGATTWGKIKS